ncbi:MAG: hypothetical protein ACOCVM_04335 [Desulfovibrionaceae bacterium]
METVFLDISSLEAEARFEHDEAVLVLPFLDREQAERLAPVLQRRALQGGLLVLVNDDLRLGFIKIANLVFARSSSKYFGYLAQDAFPGDGWLKCGVTALERSGGGLLAFSDGRFYGNLAVFGLVRRTWAKSLYHNAVFFPGYKSHYADTELSAIAMETDKLVFNPGCMLMEVDYEKHAKGNLLEDDALYRARARAGFDGRIEPFDPA